MANLPLKETLRRAYHELVRGRTTVRIVPASETATGPSAPPIFLTGPYRSGTTLLRYILDSHSRICCPPESCFMHVLEPLLQDANTTRGLDGMGFDKDHVTRRVRSFFSYFFEGYARSKGTPRWADKTPHYVDCLPFLYEVFPDAQFVMIYRNGLDQAHSFTQAGSFMRPEYRDLCREGEDMRVGAVRYWVEKTKKVMAFEKERPDRCFRVIYEEFCSDPEQHLRSLFAFLDEPWEKSVLGFHEFEHDRGFEDGRIIATKGISVSGGHFHDWDRALALQCMDIAAPVLETLGYSTTL